MVSRSAQSAASECSALARISPWRRNVPMDASAMFCCTDMSMTRPCCLRSSGTKPIPALIAAAGDTLRRSRLPTVTEPASYRSTPKTARATSLRPEPTSPASATISPAATVRDTSMKTPPLADGEHLFQPVRDEQHRLARLAQRLDDSEQPVHLGGGQRGGRLVHHDDPRVEGQRLADLGY